MEYCYIHIHISFFQTYLVELVTTPLLRVAQRNKKMIEDTHSIMELQKLTLLIRILCFVPIYIEISNQDTFPHITAL